MKSLNQLISILLITFTQTACATPQAGYYRVWQGFKRETLQLSQFQEALPEFMQKTHSLYGDALNQYLVALPPANKPEFVPDEFALIALSNEETYKSIRATEAGQAYGEAHWDIFEKSKSKSAPLNLQIPESLIPGQSYDLIGTPNDWASGHTTFFVGLRKNNISSEQFLKNLSEHVKLVAHSLKPMGLRGYIMIASENYEVAYMNWESKEAMEKAFAESAGQSVAADGARILETIQWQSETLFDGEKVTSNSFYRTKSGSIFTQDKYSENSQKTSGIKRF